jgi:hypothetical protein
LAKEIWVISPDSWTIHGLYSILPRWYPIAREVGATPISLGFLVDQIELVHEDYRPHQ